MEKILVLDFGGQYNQLIARRVRDNNVYAEILPYTAPLSEIKEGNYKGIIFTGGPNSVFDMSSPHYTKEIWSSEYPYSAYATAVSLFRGWSAAMLRPRNSPNTAKSTLQLQKNSLKFLPTSMKRA